ncbi:MAG: hypothetical protein GWP62_01750 [Gammaproteobacteria bacterium]|jgi:hypothetical protein|nr:hypothetical protein [Gammaproteobacteria bacterium]
MSDSEKISWRQLREFADVDLARSFVLSWRIEGETLVIDIDLYLEADHPFYEKPRPAEKNCIRPAVIEFPYCEAVRTDAGDSGEVIDIVEELANGAIGDLDVLDDGRYAISGEFGTVSVIAERPILRLKGL